MLRIKKFFHKDFLIIFALGMSCGLPLALIYSTLKAFLTEKGFGIELIGLLSLVTIPYSIKFLFAPFIDSVNITFLSKFFDRKRSWIFLNQVLLAILIFLFGIFAKSQSAFLMFALASLVAIFSANQDISVDAYRIELFQEKNQGPAASYYIFGYRIGLLISGALSLFLSEILSWRQVYFILSILMLAFTLVTIFSGKTKTVKQKSQRNFMLWLKSFVIIPLLDFTKKVKWYLILLFIVSFKLSDAFAGSLTIPFLLEIGFSKSEIAAIVKTFGLFATLCGVFVGGFIVKRIGIYKGLFLGVIVQMLSNFTFAYLAKIGYNIEALYCAIFIENFSGGIGDAIFVAYLSILCNVKFSAMQYAILSSFATFARSIFSSASGVLVAQIGWYEFFIFTVFLSIPSLILLALIKNKTSKNNA